VHAEQPKQAEQQPQQPLQAAFKDWSLIFPPLDTPESEQIYQVDPDDPNLAIARFASVDDIVRNGCSGHDLTNYEQRSRRVIQER